MEPYTPEKLPISNINWDKFISKIGEANRNLARYDGTLSAMIQPETFAFTVNYPGCRSIVKNRRYTCNTGRERHITQRQEA